MNDQMRKILGDLSDAVTSEAFSSTAEDAVDGLNRMPDSFDAVDPILRLIERNPDMDFGMPGPLVHFVEQFFGQGYEEQLIASLRRAPTDHTLWMLNRVINGSGGDERVRFVRELDAVVGRVDIDMVIRKAAEDFRSLHSI